MHALVAVSSPSADTPGRTRRVGSGKTEFARAFIRQFTHMPHLVVASPTFTLDITYEHAGHT